MATWSELPLVSIAQNSTFVPQFYIPEIITLIQERQKVYQYAGFLDRFGYRDRVGQTFSVNMHDKIGTRGTNLAAGTKIPLSNIVTYNVVGTIAEMGNGVKMEKFLLNVSPSDIEGRSVRIALADDIVNNLDLRIRDVVVSGTSNRVQGGTYGTVGQRITFGTYASGKMTWSSLLRLNTQKNLQNIEADMPLFMHPYQVEDLLSETATGGYTDITKYTETGVARLFAGEIGKVMGFRIVPLNRTTGTLEQASSGTVQTADAFAFVPEQAVAIAWALAPEFRYEPNYDTDFQRTSALAWYGQGGAVLLIDRYTFQIHSTVKSTI